MQLIPDIRNWHRFRSVQFGMLAAACGAALTAYGAALAISPNIVEHVPHWILTALCIGSMAFSFAGVIARGIDQPNLRSKQ